MKKLLYSLFAIVFLMSCKTKYTEKQVSCDSQLFYNADILSMQGDSPLYAEAIVEQAGKIVFIGSLEEAEKAYSDAKKIDLEGRTLLPGFIDPHSHIGMVMNTMGQANLNTPPVGDITNIPALLNKLVAFKEEKAIPEGEWVFAWGYDEGQLEEKRHLNKMDLDDLFPNHPVYVVHTSGHMGVANSLALKAFNITADTPNPEGGAIIRIPNSDEPSGLVQETAIYPFMELMLNLLGEHKAEYFESAQDYYIKNGVTTAQDGMTDSRMLEFF